MRVRGRNTYCVFTSIAHTYRVVSLFRTGEKHEKEQYNVHSHRVNENAVKKITSSLHGYVNDLRSEWRVIHVNGRKVPRRLGSGFRLMEGIQAELLRVRNTRDVRISFGVPGGMCERLTVCSTKRYPSSEVPLQPQESLKQTGIYVCVARDHVRGF